MHFSVATLLLGLLIQNNLASNLFVPQDASFALGGVRETIPEASTNQVLARRQDLTKTAKCPPYVPGNFTARYFRQSIDHKTSETFDQRYFVNADYYKPGGPAFLYISGEQAARSTRVSSGLIVDLAKEHNGIIYALEHRYYGVSLPFKKLTADNLIHLSSENGLKDLAVFARNVINPVTHKRNIEKTKWYAIGGSYAGAMAAWVRQHNPNIFDGALSSSGPVLAKEDYFEYDVSVGETVGPKCLNHINQAVKYIDNIYTTDKAKFKAIKDDLGCGALTDDKQTLYTIFDTIASIVQYNTPTSNPSVNSFCNGFASTVTPEQKFINLIDTVKLYYKNNNNTCLGFASEEDLLNLIPAENSIMRQWNYQCCTEFGYWQTAPTKAQSPQLPARSTHLTVDFFNDFFCSERIYGKKIGPPNTAAINSKRGGKDIKTDRIIFTNGDKDPWEKLSVTDVTKSTLNRPILIIKNGSHVNDLGALNPNASPSIQEVQKTIVETIRRWIKN